MRWGQHTPRACGPVPPLIPASLRRGDCLGAGRAGGFPLLGALPGSGAECRQFPHSY